MEIEAFRPREYWQIKALLSTPRGQEYEARLTVLGGKKLDRFDIGNATQAELAVQAVASRKLKIDSVEARPSTRNPSAPFMTSTLQQEASRKFGMGACLVSGLAGLQNCTGHSGQGHLFLRGPDFPGDSGHSVDHGSFLVLGECRCTCFSQIQHPLCSILPHTG